MTDFKFKVEDIVEIYRIESTRLHGVDNIGELKSNIGSFTKILTKRHSAYNGNIYSLSATCPSGTIGTWWFSEGELRLKKDILLTTKDIIGKVFTGINYD